MIGDYVLPLIGLVGGLVLFTVLVAVLLVPSLRRFGRARQALQAGLASGTSALAAVRAARRSRS